MGGTWSHSPLSNSGPNVLVQMKSALICLWPSAEISSKTGQTATYDALCTTKGTQLTPQPQHENPSKQNRKHKTDIS